MATQPPSLRTSCSYVKWLEAAGAQVVPIIISIDDSEDLTAYFQEVIITATILSVTRCSRV